jgi:hypothetical protein
MAGTAGHQSRAGERPVNCPRCGVGNTPAGRSCRGCGQALGDLRGGLPVSSSEQAAIASARLQTKGLPAGRVPPMSSSMQRARDGSEIRWGEADTPVPPAIISPGVPACVKVAVSPLRPGHGVTVEYRVNGGAIRQAIGRSELRVSDANGRVFRAVLPGQSDGTVEFLPVLRFAGQPISPRLGEVPECPRYQVGGGAVPVEAVDLPATPSAKSAGEIRWDWDATFLWAGTVAIRTEVVGALPDGLLINWRVTEGRVIGPRFEGVVLPGGADWIRIREDGVAIVNVTECLQTPTGALINCSYGGIFDLGPEGYTRALHGEFDPLPPFIIAPTYVTADKKLAWLNRAQCIGVGRVDMKALRAECDIYVLSVGRRKTPCTLRTRPEPFVWRRTDGA